MLARILQQSTISKYKVYYSSKLNLCYLCLSASSSRQGLCDDCLADLPRLGTACPQCAEPNLFGHMCGRCLAHPPAFARVITPFQYSSPLNVLIPRLKQGHNGVRPALVNALLPRLEDYEFDAIVPMPYHWTRLIMRGYHPTAHLADLISKHLSIPNYRFLKRIHRGTSQQGLSRTQRIANVRHAFRLTPSQSIRHKNLLLVDDVMTTGATANEASKTLISAGAKSVSIACLARTPTQTG